MTSDSTISTSSYFRYAPGDSCRICLDGFEEKPLAIVKTCKHLFHRDCIKEWLESKPLNARTCVLCRGVAPALVGPDGQDIALHEAIPQSSTEAIPQTSVEVHYYRLINRQLRVFAFASYRFSWPDELTQR